MSQLAGTPVIILKEGSTRERGRGAQHANIMAARIVAETVKSALGPKGMDKMLVAIKDVERVDKLFMDIGEVAEHLKKIRRKNDATLGQALSPCRARLMTNQEAMEAAFHASCIREGKCVV